jgi:hypothetical protein
MIWMQLGSLDLEPGELLDLRRPGMQARGPWKPKRDAPASRPSGVAAVGAAPAWWLGSYYNACGISCYLDGLLRALALRRARWPLPTDTCRRPSCIARTRTQRSSTNIDVEHACMHAFDVNRTIILTIYYLMHVYWWTNYFLKY